MDMARALHKLDPKARYLLNHSQADDRQKIIEWRGPGPQPTDSAIDAAWLMCKADDAWDEGIELDRDDAIGRLRADPNQQDIIKVLRL